LYEQVYEQLKIDLPVPDLVICLQAPVEVLLERVRRRGVNISSARLNATTSKRLNEAYTNFFLPLYGRAAAHGKRRGSEFCRERCGFPVAADLYPQRARRPAFLQSLAPAVMA